MSMQEEGNRSVSDERFLNMNVTKLLPPSPPKRDGPVIYPQHQSSPTNLRQTTEEFQKPSDFVGDYRMASIQDDEERSSLDKEVSRLKVLRSYLGVLECDHGNKFERLTALASRIFRVPMALVTIADLDKQYCLSARGMDYSATRKSPLCSHAILADSDILVVEDAASDQLFSNDPQVTGYPNVRFYAGAPLVCPEGYRLGTLCVMDSNPRLGKLSLEEKQSLMELAAMAMEALIDLLETKRSNLKDPTQQIACTAHDLLTPLTGIALSLSCLKEDAPLQEKLSDQQRDMIETASNCASVMNKICHKTMVSFRDQAKQKETSTQPKNAKKIGPSPVKVAALVKNLNMVIEPFPKRVPIIIKVDPSVPPEFVSDDMKIFRAAANFLTNSCAKTETGSICLTIFTRKNKETQPEIVFECEDTGCGIDAAKYRTLFKPIPVENRPSLTVSGSQNISKMVETGLGLYSVATQISSIGGKYGFRPRVPDSQSSPGTGSGSVFWFAIPLILPSTTVKKTNPISDKITKKAQMLGLLGSRFKVRDPSSLMGSATKPLGLRKLSSEDALEVYTSKPKASLDQNRMNATMTIGRKKQVLVIEDSLVVRKSIARVMTNLGCEVTQAVNGMEGLKELKASLYDLVLCDFLMPVMDGLDCIQQYRKWEKVNRPYFSQYIVGISAHASEKDVEQAFKMGMSEFRSKPVTYKQLVDLKNGKEFKRSSAELDTLGHQIQCMKRRKIDQSLSVKTDAIHSSQRLCLVIEGTSVISRLAKLASETIGWKIVSSGDSENTLGLLKMRNWDAVLVDDDELGCSRCIMRFREWEQSHRVNRQKNVILLSAKYVSSQMDGESSFQVPTGFDGALGKPIELHSLQSFLEKASSGCDIVTR